MDTNTSQLNNKPYPNPEPLTGERERMVNGTAELSNDAYAAQELGKILTELRSTLQSMAEENKQLIQTVKYYGYEPWKSVTLLDRGAKARRVYERVMGRRFDEQHKG
jgi:hypothetical protein